MFGKWALAELSVGHMILYRFLFASLGLIPVVWHTRSEHVWRMPSRDVLVFLLAALCGVPLQYLVQFKGLAYTTVTHAALMVGMVPALLAAGATLFAGERLDRTGWLAIAISTCGIALITLAAARAHGGAGGHGPTLLGDSLVAASLVAGVAWVLLSQQLMSVRGYPPGVVSAYIILAGTGMLIIWVIATQGLPPLAISARAWISVVAQGLLVTALTTVLWNWGLARVPASQAGLFVNLEPVIGSALGVLVFGDRLGPSTLLGGVLVIGAAVIVTRVRAHAGVPERESERAMRAPGGS